MKIYGIDRRRIKKILKNWSIIQNKKHEKDFLIKRQQLLILPIISSTKIYYNIYKTLSPIDEATINFSNYYMVEQWEDIFNILYRKYKHQELEKRKHGKH
ncbi:MAG: hypothetical protein [Caudoviricetes sp.]|nr:MAG: hypothetical protein [Caudoviricetes sp.]